VDKLLTVNIVTPVFNEAENVLEFAKRAARVGRDLREHSITLEIVLVDDHSHDATPELAKTVFVEHGIPFKYLRLSRNSGSHTAVAAGLHYCAGDCAIIMAADLQDPPEMISQLLERWRAGNDVVWAGRSVREGESLTTRAAARIYYRLMRLLALPDMPAKGADVVLLDRKVIDAYNTIPEKHTSLMAMILWMGFRQTSIEYVKQARHAGRSKWTFAKKLKLFIDSMVSFSYAPIRFMSLLGMLMAVSGFVYALAVVVGRLTGWVAAGTGFAALMTVLLVGQGGILLMLGILGEYLWRTFDEARGRPRYIIEEYITSKGLSSTSHTEDNPS
jgi:dolichol-phosphate mannosyltransferase